MRACFSKLSPSYVDDGLSQTVGPEEEAMRQLLEESESAE